jgi:hypothetical protein
VRYGSGGDFAWYVMQDGQTIGPMSPGELALLGLQGHVTGADLVWCEGMAGWLPLAQALGAIERPMPLESVTLPAANDTRRVRDAAQKVASLARLYQQSLAAFRQPRQARQPSRMV